MKRADRRHTYVSTGFAVVASLGNGVEGLLTFHAQRHLLLSDWGRRPLPQLHAALTDSDTLQFEQASTPVDSESNRER